MRSLSPVQKISIVIFRFYPPFCAMVMMHHVIALIFGYDLCLHEFLVDSSVVALIMQLLMSKTFGFCGWHRACIIYSWVVSFCVDYQRSVGFGDLRDPLRWAVLIIGIVIIVMFVYRCLTHAPQSDLFNQ